MTKKELKTIEVLIPVTHDEIKIIDDLPEIIKKLLINSSVQAAAKYFGKEDEFSAVKCCFIVRPD